MEDDEDTIETVHPDINSGEVVSQSRISHDFLPTVSGEAKMLGELIEALGKEKAEYERAEVILSDMPQEHPGRIIYDVFCKENYGRIPELLPHVPLLRHLLKGWKRDEAIRVMGTLRSEFPYDEELLDVLNKITIKAYIWMKDRKPYAAQTVGMLRKTFIYEKKIQDTIGKIIDRVLAWTHEGNTDAPEMLAKIGGPKAVDALLLALGVTERRMHESIMNALIDTSCNGDKKIENKMVKTLIKYFIREVGDRMKILDVLFEKELTQRQKSHVIWKLGSWLNSVQNSGSNSNPLYAQSILGDGRLEGKVTEFLIVALGEEDQKIRQIAANALANTENPEAHLFVDVFYKGMKLADMKRNGMDRTCEITNIDLLEKLARTRYEPVAERAAQMIRNDVDITNPIKKIPPSEIMPDKKADRKPLRNRIKS